MPAHWVTGLLEGLRVFSPSPRAPRYVPRRPISLLFIFITVAHARLRKLGQVELSKRNTHVRQTVLPPAEFAKTNLSVRKWSLPAVPLRM